MESIMSKPSHSKETSSKKVAHIASKVLHTGHATTQEAMTLAGSVLTQTADKPKPKKSKNDKL